MMHRELTLRISPPSPSLERKIKQLIEAEYKITQQIGQNVNNETYLYLQLESKDANLR